MNNSNNLTKAFYEELTYPGPGTNISTLWANRIKKFVTHENFTFLDAGCGTCKTLAGILKIHEKSTGIGIDLSENSLILGEKLLKYHNLFDRSKLLKKSFNEPFKLENKFDFIIAGGSIHHSLNFKNSFKFLSDNLKSGGYFCGMVYSKRGHEYRYRLKEMLYLSLVPTTSGYLYRYFIRVHFASVLVTPQASKFKYSGFISVLLLPVYRSALACKFWKRSYAS